MPPLAPRLPLLALLLTALGTSAARAQAASPDTLAAQLRYDAIVLSVAQSELRALTSWRRLLPKLRLFSSVSSRGVLFAPVNPATGYDPYASALARWPGDTWGLTVSWDLDQLLDDHARRAARGAVALATARSALTRERRAATQHADSLQTAREAAREAERRADEHHRLAQERLRLTTELAALERRRALVATEQRFADAELAHRRDLLRLSEIAHNAGGPYEALARARLALLDAERARVRLDAEALDLDARHTLARDALASPPLGEVARSAGGDLP